MVESRLDYNANYQATVFKANNTELYRISGPGLHSFVMNPKYSCLTLQKGAWNSRMCQADGWMFYCSDGYRFLQLIVNLFWPCRMISLLWLLFDWSHSRKFWPVYRQSPEHRVGNSSKSFVYLCITRQPVKNDILEWKMIFTKLLRVTRRLLNVFKFYKMEDIVFRFSIGRVSQTR